MGRQQRYVLAAVAQGGQTQIDDIEPVKEILAEGALLNHHRQIAVGGGHDARLDGMRWVAPTGGPPSLEERAAAWPAGRAKARDLVQEDRASLGRDQQPVLGAVGPVKAPLT